MGVAYVNNSTGKSIFGHFSSMCRSVKEGASSTISKFIVAVYRPRAERAARVHHDDNKLNINMGNYSRENGNKILATDGLTDCSVLAISSKSGRILMHITGSNLATDMKIGNNPRGGDAGEIIKDLIRELSVDETARISMIFGNNCGKSSWSTIIGQEYEGSQPLRDLLRLFSKGNVSLYQGDRVSFAPDGKLEVTLGTRDGRIKQSAIDLRGQFKKTLEGLLTSPATC
ncbi:hypothetical protein [Burkholderia pyrrocinia]